MQDITILAIVNDWQMTIDISSGDHVPEIKTTIYKFKSLDEAVEKLKVPADKILVIVASSYVVGSDDDPDSEVELYIHEFDSLSDAIEVFKDPNAVY